MIISIDRCLLSFIMWSVWVVSCNTRWQLGLKQSQIPCFWHLSISQDRKIKQYLTLTSHFNVIENFGDLNSWNQMNGFNSLYSKQGHDRKNYKRMCIDCSDQQHWSIISKQSIWYNIKLSICCFCFGKWLLKLNFKNMDGLIINKSMADHIYYKCSCRKPAIYNW